MSKLKSSPIPILFVPFNQRDDKCGCCGNKYSETLLFKQKYCRECLLYYVISCIADNYTNGTYLDIHISTINSQCNEHETSRNSNFITRNIQEWCKNCSIISFFKQIPTNSSAYYDDKFSIEEQDKIIESEKDCKLCGKLIYQPSLLFEKLKICSNCYRVSYELITSPITEESIPILYLPWWDAFYICVICKVELIFENTNQKWCPHCFIIYCGCRYCLTTNIIFGYTDQSQCRKCNRIMLITMDNATISIGNNEIDKFLYRSRNIININYMKDIDKYQDVPLNVYIFLKEKIYIKFDPEAIIEWIPYSRIKNLKEIAKGTIGIVYKATWLDGGIHGAKYSYCNRKKNETIAIKRYSQHEYLLNELKLYHQCYNKSDHIIQYHGITKDPETKEYMLAKKYTGSGDLYNYLQKNLNSITWKEKLEILLQITKGLKAIHDTNFILRDFHSGNILLSQSLWKIGNLRLSYPANNTLNNEMYVGLHAGPEIFNVSNAPDIYSMGMMMWELTTGCRQDDTSLFENMNGKQPVITDYTPECFANLMKSCLENDPTKRPSITEIFETINNMEKYVEQFNQAEEKRLELIKSLESGLEPHAKVTDAVLYLDNKHDGPEFIDNFTHISAENFEVCDKKNRNKQTEKEFQSSSSKNKNNTIRFRKSSKKPRKSPNAYILFAKNFSSKEYPNLSPRERMRKAGESWRSLPNELKNSFEKYAENERILKSHPNELIFVNESPKPQKSPPSQKPPDDYETLFDEYTNNTDF